VNIFKETRSVVELKIRITAPHNWFFLKRVSHS